MNFYVLDGKYVINLDEIQSIEFCKRGVPNNTSRRVRILFKGSGVFYYDITNETFYQFAQKMMEDQIVKV